MTLLIHPTHSRREKLTQSEYEHIDRVLADARAQNEAARIQLEVERRLRSWRRRRALFGAVRRVLYWVVTLASWRRR